MVADATPVTPALDIKQAHIESQWAHDRPLHCCRFDPQSRYVFCGAEDSGLHRFALKDGAKTSFNGGHESWVMSLALSRDGNTVVSGGGDGRLVWWEAAAETPQPVRKVEAHQGWIRTLDVSPDGAFLASGGNDGVVRLWNLSDGAPVRELKGHERNLYCVAFHPSGEFLLSGDLMGKLKQWNVSTGELVREFDAAPLHHYDKGQQVDFGGVRAIAFSPDGKFLPAGGLHKATNPLGAVHEPLVLLFNWETKELAKSQIAEGITSGVIWRLRYLSDGSKVGVSSGSSGGLLIFWDDEAEKDIHRFALPSPAFDLDLAADGLRAATVHYDRHVRITRLAAKPA